MDIKVNQDLIIEILEENHTSARKELILTLINQLPICDLEEIKETIEDVIKKKDIKEQLEDIHHDLNYEQEHWCDDCIQSKECDGNVQKCNKVTEKDLVRVRR